jgi:hypothetical protein
VFYRSGDDFYRAIFWLFLPYKTGICANHPVSASKKHARAALEEPYATMPKTDQRIHLLEMGGPSG